jgi:hypothetical protein
MEQRRPAAVPPLLLPLRGRRAKEENGREGAPRKERGAGELVVSSTGVTGGGVRRRCNTGKQREVGLPMRRIPRCRPALLDDHACLGASSSGAVNQPYCSTSCLAPAAVYRPCSAAEQREKIGRGRGVGEEYDVCGPWLLVGME